MRIVDLREEGYPTNSCLWELDGFDDYTEHHFFAGDVIVRTEHGYKITFERRDLEMLRDVIALFDEHETKEE